MTHQDDKSDMRVSHDMYGTTRVTHFNEAVVCLCLKIID